MKTEKKMEMGKDKTENSQSSFISLCVVAYTTTLIQVRTNLIVFIPMK